MALNLGAFHHGGEEVVGVHFTHTAAHGATLREGIAHTETHHGVATGAAFGKLGEELAHHAEGVAVIEVVAVEHGKRLFDDTGAHHHSVVGAPRLLAVGRAGEAFGERIERLEHEFARDFVLIFGEHDVAEVFFEILTDDENELAETGMDGIVDGIVHDGLPLRAEGVELLEAAVTASHSCSEEKESGFHDDYEG